MEPPEWSASDGVASDETGSSGWERGDGLEHPANTPARITIDARFAADIERRMVPNLLLLRSFTFKARQRRWASPSRLGPSRFQTHRFRQHKGSCLASDGGSRRCRC